MDAELEDLKKKRMERQKQTSETQVVQGTTGPSRNSARRNAQSAAADLRQQSTWGQQAEAETAQQLEAIEGAVKAHLTKEALQRYGTLKIAHPETATQLILAVAQAIETGRLRGMLGDEQLKEVLQQLSRLTQKSKETRIIRK